MLPQDEVEKPPEQKEIEPKEIQSIRQERKVHCGT